MGPFLIWETSFFFPKPGFAKAILRFFLNIPKAPEISGGKLKTIPYFQKTLWGKSKNYFLATGKPWFSQKW